ncbi:MAG: hypothetical protein ABW088_05240 [Sedimenticola sp.]
MNNVTKLGGRRPFDVDVLIKMLINTIDIDKVAAGIALDEPWGPGRHLMQQERESLIWAASALVKRADCIVELLKSDINNAGR